MRASHRLLFAVSCVLATLTCMCNEFSAAEDPAPADDGGPVVDAALDVGDAAPPSPRDAHWCDDGGHAFCADFDDLGDADPPNKGWSGAFRDSVGSKLTLVQNDVQSSPNAARIELPNAAKTFFFLKHTLEAGAPVQVAKLTFSMRPKIGDVDPDAASPEYNIGSLKLLDATGKYLGSGDLLWKGGEVTAIGWKGGGGNVVSVWQRAGGPLAIDEWLVVTITLDVTAKTAKFRIDDTNGVSYGENTAGGLDWAGASAAEIEVGVWSRDEVRPSLSLTFDDIAVDVTR